MYDDVGYPEVLDVLGADVDLPALPVGTGVDGHPALLPLELVAQPDGHNLGHIEIRRRHGNISFYRFMVINFTYFRDGKFKRYCQR